jgi:hypothetical protein
MLEQQASRRFGDGVSLENRPAHAPPCRVAAFAQALRSARSPFVRHDAVEPHSTLDWSPRQGGARAPRGLIGAHWKNLIPIASFRPHRADFGCVALNPLYEEGWRTAPGVRDRHDARAIRKLSQRGEQSLQLGLLGLLVGELFAGALEHRWWSLADKGFVAQP